MSEETKLNVEKPFTDPITGKFKEGNPGGGRPKGSVSIVSAIKAKLEECPEGKEKTYLYYLVEKIFKKAVIDDDVSMIKDIIDRVDGKPNFLLEHKGEINVNHIDEGQAIRIIKRRITGDTVPVKE